MHRRRKRTIWVATNDAPLVETYVEEVIWQSVSVYRWTFIDPSFNFSAFIDDTYSVANFSEFKVKRDDGVYVSPVAIVSPPDTNGSGFVDLSYIDNNPVDKGAQILSRTNAPSFGYSQPGLPSSGSKIHIPQTLFVA